MALDRRTHTPIVSLEQKHTDASLRALGRTGALECPECHSNVHFRQGAPEHRRHFVHSARRDCPHDSQDPIISSGIALLYEWLTNKFPDEVMIEFRPHAVTGLPRPVDLCLVRDKQLVAMYWLYTGDLRERTTLKRNLTSIAATSWICIGELQNAVEPYYAASDVSTSTEHPHLDEDRFLYGDIDLRATHRDLIYKTRYDTLLDSLGSLHFLDPVSHLFTTYRDLELTHPPQRYCGRVVSTPLSSLLSHKNGEICHPGEYEHIKASPVQGPPTRAGC